MKVTAYENITFIKWINPGILLLKIYNKCRWLQLHLKKNIMHFIIIHILTSDFIESRMFYNTYIIPLIHFINHSIPYKVINYIGIIGIYNFDKIIDPFCKRYLTFITRKVYRNRRFRFSNLIVSFTRSLKWKEINAMKRQTGTKV